MFKTTPIQRIIADIAIILLAIIIQFVLTDSWPFIRTVAFWVALGFAVFLILDTYKVISSKKR